ncbi:hypothetical protein PHPALM_12635 [Phytophthora palmivora]|uniref:Uncharacterized protein n=1 Tax=Phytophthora palmivora TaxID=4796 RepID=A0A2P4XZ85_9STRA|nr:hypothetical protein PHPALM_12635 [Phytophthora palmivora]
MAPDPTPKRPSSSSRRNSQRGVAMSLETRPPRELLEKIGIKGKEIVKIIKDRDWDIDEPRGLQQQKLYYLPGAKEKGERAIQNHDYFVGEGELYAFILKQGGLRYLLPDEEHSESEVEATQPQVETTLEPDEESGNSSASNGETPGRKWKRRKKLSTARSKSVEKSTEIFQMPLPKRRRKLKKNADAEEDDEEDRIRVDPQVKLEQATYGGIGQQTEFSEYESSLTARGWRAQLLQDVDVHLLRSVAAVDRRHRSLDASNEGQNKNARPTEGPGPHVQDATEILQELDGLSCSIRASQDDLSAMIELVIVQGERMCIPDRIDPVGRIGIPGFVSTGPGSLMLVRDIERYLLLCVAAVRRYQRTRKAISGNEPASQPSSRASKRADLRALHLSIEESKRELQELVTIIAVEASQACQEASQETVQAGSQDTTYNTESSDSQGASQSTSRTTDCDAEVNTDHDQFSSQQSVSSPRRLDGGQWFV